LHRMQAEVATVFGALGLLVAALGLFGLLSYTVTLRARELAIRGAVGALPPGDLLHGHLRARPGGLPRHLPPRPPGRPRRPAGRLARPVAGRIPAASAGSANGSASACRAGASLRSPGAHPQLVR